MRCLTSCTATGYLLAEDDPGATTRSTGSTAASDCKRGKGQGRLGVK